MTYEDAVAYLLANGWNKFPTLDKMRPETKKELWVKPNEGTPQLTVDLVQMNIHNSLCEFITVAIIGEVNDIWYDLSAYSLSVWTFVNDNEKIINKLTKSWMALL